MAGTRERAALGTETAEHPTQLFPQTPADYHWKVRFNVSQREFGLGGIKNTPVSSELRTFDRNARIALKL